MSGGARLFVAVPLVPEVREALSAHLRAAFPEGLPGRAAPPDNWHLTLRFLGDATPESADAVTRELNAAPLPPPFVARFGEPGAFPRPARATVLWLGVAEGAQRLHELASTVEEAARRAGFPPERRPFAPHLTLSRLRDPADLRGVLHRLPPFASPLPVREAILYRSHLGGGPPRYEAAQRFALG